MNKHNINNGEADHMNTQYYLADEVDAELERYETARQEDARRLEQVIAERDAYKRIIEDVRAGNYDNANDSLAARKFIYKELAALKDAK